MQYVGPIRNGHVPFAIDLALCGLAYDLCHEAERGDRRKFHDYLNGPDANLQWSLTFSTTAGRLQELGHRTACYASYYENEVAGDLRALGGFTACRARAGTGR